MSTCAQCDKAIWPVPGSAEWCDRLDDRAIFGSTSICLAGPQITHQPTAEAPR